MNKKVNTILFLFGATIFNIITKLLFLFLLGYLYINYLLGYFSSENAIFWGFVIIFIGSIVISFFLYRFLLALLLRKINIDKYFDPIFQIKRKS